MGLAGKKNTVTAELYRDYNPEKPLFKVPGQGNTSFTIHDCTADRDIETIEIDQIQLTPMVVPTLDQQDPWESRRAWQKVLASIEKGNVKGVSENKRKIEEAQRVLRREEQEKGIEWPRVFYRREEPDTRRLKLLETAGKSLNEERTGGFWRFIGIEKAESIHKPYHEGLTPTGHVR